MIEMYSAFIELDKLGYENAFVFSCDTPLKIIKLLIKKFKDHDCCIPRCIS